MFLNQGLLGIPHGENTYRANEELTGLAGGSKHDTRAAASPTLFNILACLRLPPRSRFVVCVVLDCFIQRPCLKDQSLRREEVAVGL